MKSLGIRYQILLITLIPVLLVDGYFTWGHIRNGIAQETEMLRTEGGIAAREVARSAERSLAVGRADQLQARLRQLIGHGDIAMVSVFDAAGDAVATAAAPGFDPAQSIDYLYFREAIASRPGSPAAIRAGTVADNPRVASPGWVTHSSPRTSG